MRRAWTFRHFVKRWSHMSVPNNWNHSKTLYGLNQKLPTGFVEEQGSTESAMQAKNFLCQYTLQLTPGISIVRIVGIISTKLPFTTLIVSKQDFETCWVDEVLSELKWGLVRLLVENSPRCLGKAEIIIKFISSFPSVPTSAVNYQPSLFTAGWWGEQMSLIVLHFRRKRKFSPVKLGVEKERRKEVDWVTKWRKELNLSESSTRPSWIDIIIGNCSCAIHPSYYALSTSTFLKTPQWLWHTPMG